MLGGPGDASILPGQSATYTCSHTLTSADEIAGSYANTATLTGAPPSGQGAPITEQSNTVIADLGAPSSPAPVIHAGTLTAPGPAGGNPSPHLVLSHVVVASKQSGSRITAALTVGGSDSAATLTGYTQTRLTTNLARRARPRTRLHSVIVMRAGRVVKAGRLRLSAALNARGRRLLSEQGKLLIEVVVTVDSVDGGSISQTRSVTLSRRRRT
jgi:hypothetical protein